MKHLWEEAGDVRLREQQGLSGPQICALEGSPGILPVSFPALILLVLILGAGRALGVNTLPTHLCSFIHSTNIS